MTFPAQDVKNEKSGLGGRNRAEGTRTSWGGGSPQGRPSFLRAVTHSHRSQFSKSMFGWQDLSTRSRPNTVPIRSTDLEVRRESFRTGCKAGGCGTPQWAQARRCRRDQSAWPANKSETSSRDAEVALDSFKVWLPGLPEAHWHRTSLGSKKYPEVYNK